MEKHGHSDAIRRKKLGLVLSTAIGLLISAPLLAQDFSGFLEDYSGLEEISPGMLLATIPNPEDYVGKFDSIMIDQPEFILAKDSKVSGLKPDEIKLIVDT